MKFHGREKEMQKRGGDENNKNPVFVILLVIFCRKQLIDYEFVSVSKKRPRKRLLLLIQLA